VCLRVASCGAQPQVKKNACYVVSHGNAFGRSLNTSSCAGGTLHFIAQVKEQDENL